MRLALVLALVVVTVVLISQAAAAPTSAEQARAVVCGQVQGPRSDWSLPSALARALGLPPRFTGRTWTVISWGTRCPVALQGTRRILRHWATARPGTIIRGHGLRGWYCAKDGVSRGGKGSPGGKCLYLAVSPRFGFIQLGSMKPAEVTRLIARGRLPSG
jgi:hypothetical protein